MAISTRRSVLERAVACFAARYAWAIAKKTYVVGSTATGVPFSFIDIKTNALTGAMVEIVKAVAQEAGFQIDLRVTTFAALIPSLTSRKIDIISAAMLKTPARDKVVDFSEPVYSYGAGLMVSAHDAREYRKIEDLKGMTVGVQVGTRFFDQLQATGAKQVKTYDSLMDMLRDLSVERINAAYGDAPIFAYEVSQGKAPKARFVKSFRPPSVEDVCLVVRKGESELLGQINASVKRIKATKIKAIIDRWSLS
jgi:polar amino acid transport system substrate-binding protein